MARDIDRKLRLTAAVLGMAARKDLAAAFRRINPKTAFDIGRADKWLQGRAQPREHQVYEDWSKVLGLDRPGQWIADCDIEAFIDEISAHHGRDREELQRALETSGVRKNGQGPALGLAGTFVSYSHAWSPYFRGRLIRGELSVFAASSPSRLPATYSENLPTGRMELAGTIAIGKRGMHLAVDDGTSGMPTMSFCLFPASPPVSVLAGLMIGTTIIGPDAQPSVTRIVMVRVPPSAAPRLRAVDASLPAQGSVAEDLATLGLHVDDATGTDRGITDFLSGGGGAFDQVAVPAYRALADLFDRSWLARTP